MEAKPPSFAAPPKSTLFGRLEAFLPKMATENQKLEAAIASGDGDRHNIEIPVLDDETTKQSDTEKDVDMEADVKSTTAPVIEMNFALGLMEEGGLDSDLSDDEDEHETKEIDLAASIAAARSSQPTAEDRLKGLPLVHSATTTTTTTTTRPLIQELN